MTLSAPGTRSLKALTQLHACCAANTLGSVISDESRSSIMNSIWTVLLSSISVTILFICPTHTTSDRITVFGKAALNVINNCENPLAQDNADV